MIFIAESYSNLDGKFQDTQKSLIQNVENISDGITYDELKMYFGEDYWVTDKICIKVPRIGDILEFGDSKFYSIVSTLCANPTSFRLQLWKNNIDWNEISEFDLFSSIIKELTPNETSLLFGNLNLSWFMPVYDKECDCKKLLYIPRNEQGGVDGSKIDESMFIDELIYTKIIKYIRDMFDIHPKVEKAKNKATKKAMIWEDEMNLQAEMQKNKNRNSKKSFLLPLVSSMVNHPGFKYKIDELKDVNIVQFMDSVRRLQTYESVTALMHGMYSGFLDTSKLNMQKDLNWLKDLNE